MRLINARRLTLETFTSDSSVPPYVILSHTWGTDELTLQEFEKYHEHSKGKLGYSKIQQTCLLATHTYNVDYVWIDTCCIDKESSAELSEAINSMYRWYQNAMVCVVYLEDLEVLPPTDTDMRFLGCRWFTRGWCLQELVAPRDLEFYLDKWKPFGTRHGLASGIQSRTGIPQELLRGVRQLSDYSVAQRMSWAAHRNTTRIEDKAYSLLGLFNVNMPLLYGEGPKAFLRLQEEILSESEDQSIFAWRRPVDDDEETLTGLFAQSPDDFAVAGNYTASSQAMFRKGVTLSNRGVKFEAAMLYRERDDEDDCWVLMLDVTERRGEVIGIFVMQIAPNIFQRIQPGALMELDAGYLDMHFSHQSKVWLDIFEPQVLCNYTMYMPKAGQSSLQEALINSARMVSGGIRLFPRIGSMIASFKVLNVYPGTLWFSEMGSFVSWPGTAFAGYIELQLEAGTFTETEPITLAMGKDRSGRGWCHLSRSASQYSSDIRSRIESFHTGKLKYDANRMTSFRVYQLHGIHLTYPDDQETGLYCSATVRFHPVKSANLLQVHFSVDKEADVPFHSVAASSPWGYAAEVPPEYIENYELPQIRSQWPGPDRKYGVYHGDPLNVLCPNAGICRKEVAIKHHPNKNQGIKEPVYTTQRTRVLPNLLLHHKRFREDKEPPPPGVWPNKKSRLIA